MCQLCEYHQSHLLAIGYDLSTAAALITWRRLPIQIRVDADPEWRTVEDVAMVAIGNGPYIGHGLRMAPGADPCDGLFHIVVVSDKGVLDFILLSKCSSDKSASAFAAQQYISCLVHALFRLLCHLLSGVARRSVLWDGSVLRGRACPLSCAADAACSCCDARCCRRRAQGLICDVCLNWACARSRRWQAARR